MFQLTFCENKTICCRLKSTLLLKIACQDTQIYMKTESLQTKWDAALFAKDRVMIIKSLICAIVGKDLNKLDQSRSKM